jgi:hypothetical protein
MNERGDEADDSHYVVDVRQTFYANLMWLWMSFIVLCFLFIATAEIITFTGLDRLVYLIVFLFTFVKLLGWLHAPRLMLKEKEKNL